VTRCPDCGSRVAGDASRCPVCGRDPGDTIVVVDLDDGSDEQRLDPAAQLRAREERFADLGANLGTVPRRVHGDRSWRTPVTLLAVLVAMLTLTALTGPSDADVATGAPPRPAATLGQLTERTRTTLLLLGSGTASELDVDRRRIHAATLPGLPTGELRAVITRGDSLVLQVDHNAFAVPRSRRRPAVALGPADSVIAAATDDRVWLVTYPAAGISRAREIGLDGVETQVARDVDGAAVIVAAVDRGLVVATQPDSAGRRPLEVHDPRDGSIVRTVTRRGIVLAARHDRVVWQAPDCRGCPIEVTDVRTGQQRPLRRAATAGATVHTAAFSPDGRTLALFESAADRPGVRVVLVDVGRGSTTSADVGSVSPTSAAVVWSASGRWLFFGAGNGIVAVRRDGSVRAVGATASPFTTLVTA
jgi:hypothetical protein